VSLRDVADVMECLSQQKDGLECMQMVSLLPVMLPIGVTVNLLVRRLKDNIQYRASFSLSVALHLGNVVGMDIHPFLEAVRSSARKKKTVD